MVFHNNKRTYSSKQGMEQRPKHGGEVHSSQPIDQVQMQCSTDSDCERCCMQVLVSGIPANVTDDHLTNFLESLHQCDCKVANVQRGCKLGVAVVNLSESIDLSMLEECCKNNYIMENKTLLVSPVDIRGAILLVDPPMSEKIQGIQFYFKNKKNGGENGAEVEFNKNLVIVYFSTRDVAKEIEKKDHKFNGVRLHIKAFDQNLHDFNCKECFVEATTAKNSTGSFQDDESPIRESQGLVSSIPNGQFCSTTNTENGQFCSTTNTENGQFCSTTNSENGSKNLSHYQRQDKTNTTDLEVKEICHTVAEIHKMYVQIFRTLCPWGVDCFDDIQVNILETSVELKGECETVLKAKQLLDNLLSQQMSSHVLENWINYLTDWEDIFKTLECEVEEKFVLMIREGLLEEELCIRDKTERKDMTFDEFIDHLIGRKEIPVPNVSAINLLFNGAFEEFEQKEFYDNFGEKAKVIADNNKNIVVVLADMNVLRKAVLSVNEFLQNAQYRDVIQLSPKEIKFLKQCHMEELKELQSNAEDGKVNLTFKDEYCIVEGCRAGVKMILDKLKTFCRNLQCIRVIFSYSGVRKIANSATWKSLLSCTSEETCCIIDDLPDSHIKADDEFYPDSWGPWSASVIHSHTFDSGKRCHLVDGDVRDMKVDAIVLCTDLKWNSACMSFGEETLKDTRSSPFLVTQSGALPCKAIIHIDHLVSLTDEEHLTCLIDDILQTAEIYSLSSIALPTIGVEGNCTFPIGIATRTVFQTIKRHCEEKEFTRNPNSNHRYLDQSSGTEGKRKHISTLRDICLCSTKSACLRGFLFAMNSLQNSPSTEAWKMVSCVERPLTANKKIQNDKVIQIVKGDITNFQADILVVHLDSDFDLHKNKITHSLSKQAGLALESEVYYGESTLSSMVLGNHKSLEKRESREDEFAETRFLEVNSHLMRAKRIFFLNLPPWGPKAREILKELLQKCLQVAGRKYKSIAIPALGLGTLGYPLKFVARSTVGIVADYLEQTSSSLETVNFVILPTDWETYQEFSTEQFNWRGQRLHFQNTSPDRSEPPYSPNSQRQIRNREHGRESAVGGQSNSLFYGNPYHGSSQSSQTFSLGLRKLTVKFGDITQETCHVIVNSTNSNLDLSHGAVSKRLQEICGTEITEEIQSNKSRLKKLKSKGLVMTEATNMKCKKILHIDLDSYRKDKEKMLQECLFLTDSTDKNFNSIAFPVLGSGRNRNSSPQEMAETLVKVVSYYTRARRIVDVYLVVFDPELYISLVNTVQKLQNHICPKPKTEGKRGGKQKKKHQAANPNTKYKYQEQAPLTQNSRANTPLPSHSFRTNIPPLSQTSRISEPHPFQISRYSEDAISAFIFTDSDEIRQEAKDMLEAKLQQVLELKNDLSTSNTNEKTMPETSHGKEDEKKYSRKLESYV